MTAIMDNSSLTVHFLFCMDTILLISTLNNANVGFLIYVSHIHLRFNFHSRKRIESSDPRWVGAWWIGFLVTCVIALFPVIPLLGYPAHMDRKSTLSC